MAVTEFHCLNSVDDQQIGDGASTGTTVMVVQHDNTLVLESFCRIHLDTSGIGTDTISAATFHWYAHTASTKGPKAATWDHYIEFNSGATFYSNTSAAEPAGWSSHALTGGELAGINKSGDTVINFMVPDPGSTYGRKWQIRAWDYVPNGDFSAYLEITHAASGGPTKMTIIGV